MNIKNKKTIVIKIGTTSLIDEGKLSQTLLHSLAEKIKQHQNTHNFVIVTSGAVSLGGMELNYKTRPKSMKKLQVASAVGQIQLINEYKKVFNENDLQIAQVLITKNLIDDREQFVNTTQSVNELEELKFGDNDRLSAIVSIIVNASKLILVTNKQGLYNFNPDKNSDAKMIEFIQFNSSQLNDLIPISSHGEGEGGFSTKIMAAQIAGFSGIQTQIISWSEQNFVDAIKGKQVGTLILESDKKIRLRKLWIAYGMQSTSKIEIDAGAFDAIKKNASLLCNGVVKVHKDFNIGDGIDVVLNDINVAKGIAKISSNEISDNIVLIHIDDLIIL